MLWCQSAEVSASLHTCWRAARPQQKTHVRQFYRVKCNDVDLHWYWPRTFSRHDSDMLRCKETRFGCLVSLKSCFNGISALPLNDLAVTIVNFGLSWVVDRFSRTPLKLPHPQGKSWIHPQRDHRVLWPSVSSCFLTTRAFPKFHVLGSPF